jgi:hypothetical protein
LFTCSLGYSAPAPHIPYAYSLKREKGGERDAWNGDPRS